MNIKNIKPIHLIYGSLFSAIVFVFTYIGIQLPAFGAFGGLTHLGTLVMFLISIKYGKYYGALSGAIGMSLFDLLSPWSAWAIGTFIIRLIAGFLFGLIAQHKDGQGSSKVKNWIALGLGGAVIVIGYFIFEAIFLSSGFAALRSVPGNILQIVIASAGIFIYKSMPELKKYI
ncbi:Predicted membrane protein [Acholeplasma oculi]|nr:ECF transporter S component [Acholeplasma oculi]SKC35479.1 Uncharacterized membrane protein [Acholeplasma oculi]SUT90088.1 Predicted membrane protein [Acholeplasma oculi]